MEIDGINQYTLMKNMLIDTIDKIQTSQEKDRIAGKEFLDTNFENRIFNAMKANLMLYKNEKDFLIEFNL